ncbi:hypothetical protein PVAND_016749 [Polypedilum vanderplanki]|uniref:F-box domain-containing protein n=1 Tax=Polypedilum vanderplanki TaxID=319348 RepID=A0A9J6BGJ9_POLVA|nr:hypothetical protein PVAND_016749 [Polypedilum vanderplanki]
MENSANLYNLPNEILLKIFKFSQNHKNLSEVCKRFYELTTFLNEDNLSLTIKCKQLINPHFDLEKILNDSSSIILTCNSKGIKNFNDKFDLFLKYHGHKINTITDYNQTHFDIRKFIHLMPNLEKLSYKCPTTNEDEEISFDNFKDSSVPLKNLEIFNDPGKVWTIFKIFNIEELTIKKKFQVDENFLEFFACCKNLKNVVIEKFQDVSSLLEILSTKQLESFKIIFELDKEDDDEIILKFLETQKNLKSIKIHQISDKILSYVCKNFKNLESLSIRLSEDRKDEIFLKINNLKSLKTLTVKAYSRKQIDFENLCTFSLPNLEKLNFDGGRFEKFLIKKLADNFKNIKSLKMYATPFEYYEILLEILTHFNQLESLSVSTSLWHLVTIPEEFFTTLHSNPNLKTFIYEKQCFDKLKDKMKLKMTRDFPNLENYPEEVQYYFAPKYDAFSLKHFLLDLTDVKNGNEILKDCSVIFNTGTGHNVARAKRDGKKEITIDIKRYFYDQQFKTILKTPRKLKEITIVANIQLIRSGAVHYLEYLKSIGENVTSLTIQKSRQSDQQQSMAIFKNMNAKFLSKIIESFPNLKTLKLEISSPKLVEKAVMIKNTKIEEIILIASDENYSNRHYEHSEYFKDFFKHFQFPENSLKSFKIISESYKRNETFDNYAILDFLENQNLLTEFNENRSNEERWENGKVKYVYTYEALSE